MKPLVRIPSGITALQPSIACSGPASCTALHGAFLLRLSSETPSELPQVRNLPSKTHALTDFSPVPAAATARYFLTFLERPGKSLLPDMAVRSALLLNSSVTPRPLQTSFRSISCSTVNLEKGTEKLQRAQTSAALIVLRRFKFLGNDNSNAKVNHVKRFSAGSIVQ